MKKRYNCNAKMIITKRRNYVRKRIFLGIVFIIASMSIIVMETAAEERRIKSRGSIEGYESFYSDDIRYLEGEIRELLAECRED